MRPSIYKDVRLHRLVLLPTLGPRTTILRPGLSLRFTSTFTGPDSTPKSQPSPVPPILNASSTRKPKIDLRPGPQKPQQSSSPKPPPQTFIPPPAKAALTQRKALPAAPTPNPGEKQSFKETIQADIQDAEDRGILRPTPPDAPTLNRFIHKSWEIMKFYFRGVKLVYTRLGEVRRIKQRVKAGGIPLQRWENRLIRTERQDVIKIMPFLVLALLLEEAIPLLALYAPFSLPSVCLLPGQQRRIGVKKTEKAVAARSENAALFKHLKLGESPSGMLSPVELKANDASHVLCTLLRLSTFGLDAMRLSRIRKHLLFIAKDDELLVQDQLIERLNEQELDEALEERGFIVSGLSVQDKKSRLQWWLQSVAEITQPKEVISRRLSLIIGSY